MAALHYILQVISLDTVAKSVMLASGEPVQYDKLLIATGAM